jgi:N-acetylneuraminic acid mutarotase
MDSQERATKKLVIFADSFAGTEEHRMISVFVEESQNWLQLPPMTKTRDCPTYAMDPKRLLFFVIGGEDGHITHRDAEMFSFHTSKWYTLDCMFRSRTDSVAEIYNDKLYVIGGNDGTQTIEAAEALDLKTFQWESISPMTSPREKFAAVVYNDKLIVFGGSNRAAECLDTGEIYDFELQFWSPLHFRLPSARISFGRALCGDQLFVFGGFGIGSEELGSVYSCDLNTGTWNSIEPPMPTPSVCGGILSDRKLYVRGRVPLVLDLEAHQWTELPPSPSYFDDGGICFVAHVHRNFIGFY